MFSSCEILKCAEKTKTYWRLWRDKFCVETVTGTVGAVVFESRAVVTAVVGMLRQLPLLVISPRVMHRIRSETLDKTLVEILWHEKSRQESCWDSLRDYWWDSWRDFSRQRVSLRVLPRVSGRILCMTLGETFSETRFFTWVATSFNRDHDFFSTLQVRVRLQRLLPSCIVTKAFLRITHEAKRLFASYELPLQSRETFFDV